MNRPIDDFEVIVLGSGLGGLVAAAVLSKAGRRVLLLKEKGYESSCRREGYRFVPFSNFSEKCPKVSLLQRVSKDLGLSSPDGSPEPVLPKIFFQVILPGARIDLFDDFSLLQEEWRREFPDELNQIRTAYDEFTGVLDLLESRRNKEGSPHFPIAPRSLIRHCLSFLSLSRERRNETLSSLSKEFNELVHLQLMARGNFYPDALPFSLTAYLLLHGRQGGWISPTDPEEFEHGIVDAYLRWGGGVEEIEGVESVERKWRKGFTVIPEGESRVFQGRSLILNAPLHTVTGLLGRCGKSLSKWLEKVHPRYLLFPVFLGIRDKAVPVGMGDLLVSMLDLQKPYEDGNVLLMALSSRGDEAAAPEGHRALTIQSLVPYTAMRNWNQVSFASHQESVMKHVNRLFPFLDRFLELADFDWARQQVRRWSYPLFLCEAVGEFDWREGLVPNRLSKDLYFIGKECFPYLGLEGEVLSGLRVAQEMLEK